MTDRPDVFVIDGRHLLYRSMEVGQSLTAIDEHGDEVQTGGFYGFLNACTRLQRKYGGKYVVCWESKQNFRKRVWSGYKKRADPTEERVMFSNALGAQEKLLREALCHLGVRQAWCEDGEADDAIGTISTHLSRKGKTVAIYSGDVDLHQLVNERVWVLAPVKKGKIAAYGPAEVLARHEVRADQIPDLKALAGDKSDGIPGMPGIGPATAAKMVSEHETLEGVLAAAKTEDWKFGARFQDIITKGAGDARIFLELTTIRCESALILKRPKYDPNEFRRILKRLDVRRFLERGPWTDLNRMRL